MAEQGSNPLRVAVVGTGYFSQFHFDAWTRCREVELVAVCGLDRAATEETAKNYGIGAVYGDAATMLDAVQPDLVDIITPPPTHLELIRLACDRQIDAVCQKPFCGDLDTARKATELAERAGIRLIVHENFRFQPWYRTLAENLSRLGTMYQATFRLRPGDGQGDDAYLARQPYFQTMPRLLVHETLVHLVDVMRFFFGEASHVFADLRRLNPAIKGEDAGLVIMDMGAGLRAVIDGNRLSDHVAENRRLTMGDMLIEGERGVLSLNGDGIITLRVHGENASDEVRYHWRDRGFGGDCVHHFTRHVVDHIVLDAPLETSARDYLANLYIEDAIYRSHERGVRVALQA